MQWAKMQELSELAKVLDANRAGTTAILEAGFPGIAIKNCDEFPYRAYAVPARYVTVDQVHKLNARGCSCYNYGNAAKAGSGEGQFETVIYF
jgi:hypothetical protein